MIAILHGYLLDGSGSNLWTRSVLRALCRDGRTVHLVCQEPHPERYDFIAAAYSYDADGEVTTMIEREVPYPGRCIMHKPQLEEPLPVYVWDQYEEFEEVVPIPELSDAVLEEYVHRNVQVVTRVVREHGIDVLHANHAALMSVVAQRTAAWTGVPYVIMPHGSALEYVVKEDERVRRLAADAFAHAARILVISDEIADRTDSTLGDSVPDLQEKLSLLDLGVDTSAFQPITRGDRPANVKRVCELLEGLPRGRSVEQDHALHEALDAGTPVATALAAVGEYVAKHPDAEVEQKLSGVDWEGERTVAFIGRLIPAKGIHAVIGALPLVLAHAARTRLIVTGHGPLRDPLEALVHALARGDRELARAVIAHAAQDDTGEPEHLAALTGFWDRLEQSGEADAYWDAASRYVHPDRVVFTGYLTHREMAWLLPCCDVAIFPSMVIEAGPLVFLEALASGVFPIGTYFGGMQRKIDRVAPRLDETAVEAMKVRPDAEHIVADIARALPAALDQADRYRDELRGVAEEFYDWAPVARRLAMLLEHAAEGTRIQSE